MGNFKKLIGKKLQDRRKEMGFKTQQALADKIEGVDRTRISRWESGENIPDLIYQRELIALLKLPQNFFTEIDTLAPNSRAQLILDIQQVLNQLSEDDLEVVKMAAEGRLELSQKEKIKKQAKG